MDVAVKTLKFNRNDPESFERESEVMRKLRNRHLVRLFGYVAYILEGQNCGPNIFGPKAFKLPHFKICPPYFFKRRGSYHFKVCTRVGM